MSDPSRITGQEQEEEQEGDGDQDRELGWYYDGVKRTLTDEQIAMFRHSEIHRLLQRRKLNAGLADLVDGRLTAKTKEGPQRTKQTKLDMEQPQSNERPASDSNHVRLEDWQERDRHTQ